ncbi:MAG: caspase family protein, partial [Prochlorotrichaceae cyanobacterium]
MAKRALLIGVSNYQEDLKPLPAAVRDVAALAEVLRDPEMGGFDEVKTFEDINSQPMGEEVETFFRQSKRDDLVTFFFSGHGVKDEKGKLFFATPNTRKDSKGNLRRATAVEASFVQDAMNDCKAKRQVVILDCCFSGAFDPALQAKDDGSVDLETQLGAEGRVVLASSSSTQYSFEQTGAELSLYTRYLVEGISTGAGDT